MNGLQAIQNRILAEANEKADQITSQARSQCEDILAAAQAESGQLLAAARLAAAAQVATVLNRARSNAALQSRKIVLQARQDLIDQVIARSIEMLGQLPDLEKIALYRQLLQQTQAVSGEILLAAADRPLSSRLLAELPGQFTIVADGSFAGGLVLRRDLIEDNLTFERLAAMNRSELVQLAAAALASEPAQNPALS